MGGKHLSWVEKILTVHSQLEYDFSPGKLSTSEILELKKLAREKRATIGTAPIGRRVFSYVREIESNIYYEKKDFNSNVDAMIYLPNKEDNIVFIIINSSKPLFNQIFACAHEYYHFLKDISDGSRVCNLNDLKNIKSEYLASRFAAEFLLPDEALRAEVERFKLFFKIKKFTFEHIILLCYNLLVKYELPPKAILYRLIEEGYINDILRKENLYEILKYICEEITNREGQKAKDLFESNNNNIEEVMHELVTAVYDKGLVTYDELFEDLNELSLNCEQMKITSPWDISNEEE